MRSAEDIIYDFVSDDYAHRVLYEYHDSHAHDYRGHHVYYDLYELYHHGYHEYHVSHVHSTSPLLCMPYMPRTK